MTSVIEKLLPSYDPSLFQGAISYYQEYRPRYPEAVYDLIRQTFDLDGQGGLLDLGCGIGLVAIALRTQFGRVVGIDPDDEMLRAAVDEAAAAGVEGILWQKGLAEDLGPELGEFRLVTIGRAFHWMDKPVVLQRSYERLQASDPQGNHPSGIAIIQTEKDIWSNDAPWARQVLAVIQRWLGEKRRVGATTVPVLYKSDLEILERSPFTDIRQQEVPFQKHWTVDRFIGYLYSTAYCRKEYFEGADTTLFEREIAEAILSVEPSGRFIEDIPISVYFGFKA